MELLKHEIYKIFHKKTILIGLIVFIPIYFIYIMGMSGPYLSSYREAGEYYKSYEGVLNADKQKDIEKGMLQVDAMNRDGVRLDSKHMAIRILNGDMANIKNDKSFLDNKKQILSNEINVSGKNSFSSRKASLELSKISSLKPIDSFHYKEGLTASVKFWKDIGCWLLIIFCLLGISDIISQEYNDGMNSLIRSTKNGRKKIVLAKMGAAFLFVLTVSTVIGILNMLTVMCFYGLADSNISIRYMYGMYSNSYADIKVWQFYLILQLFIIAGAFIICMAYMLVSVFTRNAGIPFISVIAVFLFSDIIARGDVDVLVKGFMPSEFVRLDNLLKNSSYIYNILGWPVVYEKLLFAVDLIFIAALTGIIARCFEKRGLCEI